MKLKGFEFYDDATNEWKPLKGEIIGAPMSTCASDMFFAFIKGLNKTAYIRKKEQQ